MSCACINILPLFVTFDGWLIHEETDPKCHIQNKHTGLEKLDLFWNDGFGRWTENLPDIRLAKNLGAKMEENAENVHLELSKEQHRSSQHLAWVIGKILEKFKRRIIIILLLVSFPSQHWLVVFLWSLFRSPELYEVIYINVYIFYNGWVTAV